MGSSPKATYRVSLFAPSLTLSRTHTVDHHHNIYSHCCVIELANSPWFGGRFACGGFKDKNYTQQRRHDDDDDKGAFFNRYLAQFLFVIRVGRASQLVTLDSFGRFFRGRRACVSLAGRNSCASPTWFSKC